MLANEDFFQGLKDISESITKELKDLSFKYAKIVDKPVAEPTDETDLMVIHYEMEELRAALRSVNGIRKYVQRHVDQQTRRERIAAAISLMELSM